MSSYQKIPDDDKQEKPALQPSEEPVSQMFMTEAYQDFKDRLCMDYLIAQDMQNYDVLRKKLNMVEGTATKYKTDIHKCLSIAFCWTVAYPIWWCTRTVFEVNGNHFAFVEKNDDKEGRRTIICGPGVHFLGFYYKLIGIYSFADRFPNNVLISPVGDLQIAEVEQGTIAYFEFGGQFKIFGPGIHLIREPMTFRGNVRLDNFYIEIGPEKWITVPEGYDGISVNRGSLRILEGGKQHHLTHIGDMFSKMVPKTLQSDRIASDVPGYVQKQLTG